MSVDQYFIWADNPSPRDTVVLGSYEAPFKWERFKTCKLGCCVTRADRPSWGCLTLPRYWKEGK